MGTPYSPVRHLASATHPARSRKKFLFMLTGYFDESGHSQDPACRVAGMAGFVATAGAWEVFEAEWTTLLKNACLPEAFHMRDFAHSCGQFSTWKDQEEKRRMLIGGLLRIIERTGAMPIGIAVSLDAFESLTAEQQLGFKDPYYLAFQHCTRGAALSVSLEAPDERVNTVYAFNSEFGTQEGVGTQEGGRAEQLWRFVKAGYDYGWRLGVYSSTTPDVLCPLQAADFFAYELCHEFENHIKRPDDGMRFPLRRIIRMSEIPLPMIRFFDRNELLRQIEEANFPDQTGVDSISEEQFERHKADMMRWMIRRGQWDGELPEFADWDEWKRTNRG